MTDVLQLSEGHTLHFTRSEEGVTMMIWDGAKLESVVTIQSAVEIQALLACLIHHITLREDDRHLDFSSVFPIMEGIAK